jgi:hypothetical protein
MGNINNNNNTKGNVFLFRIQGSNSNVNSVFLCIGGSARHANFLQDNTLYFFLFSIRMVCGEVHILFLLIPDTWNVGCGWLQEDGEDVAGKLSTTYRTVMNKDVRDLLRAEDIDEVRAEQDHFRCRS